MAPCPARKLLLLAALIVIVAPTTFAQPDITPATTKPLAFDVASVRQVRPDAPYSAANVDLDASDYFLRYRGGLVTTNGLLINCIIFAYKLADASQYPLIQAQLPKWAQTERFYIEARGGSSPTKDQLRLMMQSLLADRFHLAIHTETHQLPIYALVLDKPGKPGPQLQPHPNDTLCTTMPDKPTPPVKRTVPEPWCGLLFWPVNGLQHMRMMSFTMQQIAGQLAATGASMGGLDHLPILDQTGLTGKFDINLEFLREPKNPAPPSADAEAADPAPNFTEALKIQAGLKLIKQTGPVNVLIIDHVDPPTEN